MGLHANIFRGDYDCHLNVFHGRKSVCLVNVDGPFEPTPDSPAAILLKHACFGEAVGRTMSIVVPAVLNDKCEYEPIPSWERMFGGTYCSSSDSRFHEANRAVLGVQFCNGAVPIHDRKEI